MTKKELLVRIKALERQLNQGIDPEGAIDFNSYSFDYPSYKPKATIRGEVNAILKHLGLVVEIKPEKPMEIKVYESKKKQTIKKK